MVRTGRGGAARRVVGGRGCRLIDPPLTPSLSVCDRPQLNRRSGARPLTPDGATGGCLLGCPRQAPDIIAGSRGTPYVCILF